MIDWLRKEIEQPSIAIAGHDLPIAIRRHARATRLTMRLAPDGSEVRITLPRWGRTMDALVFAKSRKDWLETQLAALPQRADPVPGSTIAFRGRSLAIEWSRALPRKPALAGERLRLGGPADTIAPRIRRWLEAEALPLLRDDLAFYCQRARLECPELRLSRAQRRWGSCSSSERKGRCIRINWRLVQAPDAVRRSVVAHEVAHLVHFDHSPAFHALLGELFEGEIKAADGWLRREGRTLYTSFG